MSSPAPPSVLVLDNDAPLRTLLRAALGKHCDLRLCSHAAEAEQALLSGGVSVLLLDLHLGGGHSGDVLALDWARRGLLPPFLVLTGMAEDPRLKALIGLSEYGGLIAKPFSVADLIAQVLRLATPAKEQRA